MKGGKLSKTEKKIFNVIIKLLGFREGDDTEKLTITIPQLLYFLSSAPENGHEHLLENEEIIIHATPRNRMPEGLGFLKIKLSEEISNLDQLLNVIKQKDISDIRRDEKVLYADYRIIRRVLLSLVLYLEPVSLNFITK